MASAAINERRRGGALGLDSRRRPRRGTGAGAGCASDGADSLEDLVVATLGQLQGAGEASCLVCAGPHLAPSGCGACGAVLS